MTSFHAMVLKTQILSVFPETEVAYANLFGRNGSREALARLAEQIERLRAAGALNLGQAGNGTPQLYEAIAQAARNGKSAVILTGHSIPLNGERFLVLGDGTKAALADIHAQAAKAGVSCRILTCHGRDFGIDDLLTVREACDLLLHVTQPHVIEPAIGRETADSIRAGIVPAADQLDAWDAEVDRERERRQARGIILTGASPDEGGDLIVWESVLRRPNRTWIGVGLLLAGLATTCWGMWLTQNQLGRSVTSVDELTSVIAWQFWWTRRWKALTAGLVLVLAVAAAAWMIHTEAQLDRAEGLPVQFSALDWVGLAGAALVLLAALACRLDPRVSPLGRLVHTLTGSVAGGVCVFVLWLILLGIAALALFLLANLVHVIACLTNVTGFKRFPTLFGDSLFWAVVIPLAGAALGSIPGFFVGAWAGYRAKPVYLTVPAVIADMLGDSAHASVPPQTSGGSAEVGDVGDHAEEPAARTKKKWKVDDLLAWGFLLAFAIFLPFAYFVTVLDETPFAPGSLVVLHNPDPDNRILKDWSPRTVPAYDVDFSKALSNRLYSSFPDPFRPPLDYKRYWGPNGIVFVGGDRVAKPNLGVGEVVVGSRAVVVADDQGGRGEREVIVRMLRDPSVGADPEAVISVEARYLRRPDSTAR